MGLFIARGRIHPSARERASVRARLSVVCSPIYQSRRFLRRSLISVEIERQISNAAVDLRGDTRSLFVSGNGSRSGIRRDGAHGFNQTPLRKVGKQREWHSMRRNENDGLRANENWQEEIRSFPRTSATPAFRTSFVPMRARERAFEFN